ncbi:hypothetical protein DICSQDRAFT_139140 [Dichomitus squalens LYAD-421 SS1]|uniref:Uncharacterized protein n=1 Tax=Dichomitus squalens (strain LYAD-421) TaxID=732165 RepID=R7SSK5_DICSQ|nr:uncharacterized protein DICSQDRAFT_139140 [Dichomitus squalens LYAD-421 SS1]EJF58680.1 hypothetical protein DICSQDRAFT_139140 [Dichomitus squalens LYAD-421 SS1]
MRQTHLVEEDDHAQEFTSMREREKQRAADGTPAGMSSHDRVLFRCAEQMQSRSKRKRLDAQQDSHKHRQRQQSEMTAAGVVGVSQ